jgi:hypothetical protein
MMGFEKDGVISVWMGDFPSEGAAEEYLREQYDSDEAPLSQFAADFDIPWYDHDFLESYHTSSGTHTIREMLSGFSYSTSYIDFVVNRADELGCHQSNTVVLLLDFAYQPGAARSTSPLLFVGTFAYDATASAAEDPSR